MTISKLTVVGVEQPVNPKAIVPEEMKLKKSIRIRGNTRSVLSLPEEVKLETDDVVEFIFEDGTTWLTNPDTIEDLFPEATLKNRSVSGGFDVPLTLRPPTTDRSLIGDIALEVVNIFAKDTIDEAVGKTIRELAGDLEKKQLENQIGLYQLNANFQLVNFTPPTVSSKPYLLFLHGTCSSTRGSFSELTPVWPEIQKLFGKNILAFQHETLTKSPLENLLDLVKALPSHATFHLVSHSRGGLVGELLCRFCGNDDRNLGFSEEELKLLTKYKRDRDLEVIEEINQNIKDKNLTVEKFIRVACPAFGTTLASRRMDLFLNMAFNLVGLGTGWMGTPVYLAFKALLSATLDSKTNTEFLPGLEAMDPNSPFLEVLNNPATTVDVDNPLLVLSGNCRAGLSKNGLLVIASKLFYLTQNDLVVDTRSMVQGTRRKGVQLFFYDEGTTVNHFNYFENATTQRAILNVLKTKESELIGLSGFKPIVSETLTDASRHAAFNLDGGQLYKNTITGKRPILLLLPGIMGSNLSDEGTNAVLWIDYIGFLGGSLSNLDITNPLKPSSLVRTSYKTLADYFSTSYDVVTFPFDWRKQLNESADLLNTRIQTLLPYNQPIKVIGHSMGGVLMRDFIVTHPETWKQLNSSSGFKCLLLGAPLGGSFRIPKVLVGQDEMIDKLNKIDIFHTKQELLEIFSKFPGILSLLPHSKKMDFAQIGNWQSIWNEVEDQGWSLPEENDLEAFGKYRDTIANASIDYTNIRYIAGRDTETPCEYEIRKTAQGKKEIVFLYTAEGDQSVTWDSGIPKQLIDANGVYYVNVTHGQLANEPKIFQGIAEILTKGSTNSLSKNRPSVRGEEKLFKARKTTDFDLSERGVINTLLGLGQTQSQEEVEQPIRVSISNGDLKYAAYPILAGHFMGDGILNAEKAIDQHLDMALSDRHQLGLYPGEIGSSELVLAAGDGFKGTIIVGLGKVGNLTASQLTLSVEQGVSNYLLRINRGIVQQAIKTSGISSLMIGCGFGGLSIENSMIAIIQGVKNANQKMKGLLKAGGRLIDHIEFVEQYDDRVISGLYTLARLKKNEDSILSIVTDEPMKIKRLFGSRQRIPLDRAEEWWTRITVTLEKETEGKKDVSLRHLIFNASTSGAREEQQELFTNTPILEEIINNISTNNQWTESKARVVFELLIPNQFKEQLKKRSHINWIVDKYTATYPWELLQDTSANTQPLCISAGMVRKLATQDYRLSINAVTKKTAMVVGDPDLQGFAFAPQLEGARNEAQLVANVLERSGYDMETIINGSASQIILALFSQEYKIIHLAGHGLFDQHDPKRSGMLIGNNLFLTPFEICQMSTVPELVFVNCCHLGRIDGAAESNYRQLYKLAANIGTQLIENGVKAVIAAAWAVDDLAALKFTETFYEKMLEGYTFGEATLAARQAIYKQFGQRSNTWGAYQCYGDQFYRFDTRSDQDVKKDLVYMIANEAEIDLYNLQNELDTGRYSTEAGIERLGMISRAVDTYGLRNPSITESEAAIYCELGNYEAGLKKYETLLAMENARFSVYALEKYCTIRAKKVVADFKDATKKPVIADLDKAIAGLNNLLVVSETVERYNLLGSAYKRKGLVSSKIQEKQRAYVNATLHYGLAFLKGNHTYALGNWLILAMVLQDAGIKEPAYPGLEESDTKFPTFEEAEIQLQASLKTMDASGNLDDFWQLAEVAMAHLCLQLLRKDVSDEGWEAVKKAFRTLWAKAGTRGKRLSELEHLEILADVLSLAKSQELVEVKKRVEELSKNLTEQL